MTRQWLAGASLVALVFYGLASGTACSSAADAQKRASSDDGGSTFDGETGTPYPFRADPAEVYVAKVKNILVGLAPTQAEIDTVKGAPPDQVSSKLKALIDAWVALPADPNTGLSPYETKMLRFFELAYQQTQIAFTDVADQVNKMSNPLTNNTAYRDLLMQNIEESFARTMLMLSEQGRPMSEAMTTTQFAMTSALAEFYAFLDAYQANDAPNSIKDRLANPLQPVYVTSASVPTADATNPSNKNFMHWTNPNIKKDPIACDDAPFKLTADNVQYIVTGSVPGFKVGNTMCSGVVGSDLSYSQFGANEFNDWRLVNVRLPKSGSEPVTQFWDIPTLKKATELVLQVPRVGFFSTPAFFANWPTNDSNQMRVTMNQTFIVSTGAQIDGTDTTIPNMTPGLDTTHAGNSQCRGCHQILDPSRSILTSTYSWFYHNQDDPTIQKEPGYFVFQGQQGPMATVYDLGQHLATHPMVAAAWAQKYCMYANSTACDPTDPEFQRVVSVFATSQLSWPVLVRELLSSPLTTNAVATQTTSTTVGETIALERRDHLCAALSARLGWVDICGDKVGVVGRPKTLLAAKAIFEGLPSDSYGRGSVTPNLPTNPSLLFRAAVEDICEVIAPLVIDATAPPAGVKQWKSTSQTTVDAAIKEFVSLLLAVESKDARYDPLVSALTGVYNDTKSQGVSLALQSAFVTACTAPSGVSMGL